MTESNSLWRGLKGALAFALGYVGMATGAAVAFFGISAGYFQSIGFAVAGLLIIGASAQLSFHTLGRLGTDSRGAEQ